MIWLSLFVWLTTLVLWTFNFNVLKHYKKTLLLCIFFALVFSIPWDYLALKTGMWNFPKENNIGILLAGLPLEEFLFIIFVTLEVSTITLVLKKRVKSLINGGTK
ncbi:MAG: lycopene cyclase domain-containing protein [Candidatus Aenigmarchaeota archaeon]|nr:lycopene cyclase domain-containing protein [Candidatus Aenigmarchaeota archaeon]